LISKFEVTKIIDATLTAEDVQELQEAEEITKRFLGWDIQGEVTSLRDVMDEIMKRPEGPGREGVMGVRDCGDGEESEGAERRSVLEGENSMVVEDDE
jgi:hypothetical protein